MLFSLLPSQASADGISVEEASGTRQRLRPFGCGGLVEVLLLSSKIRLVSGLPSFFNSFAGG